MQCVNRRDPDGTKVGVSVAALMILLIGAGAWQSATRQSHAPHPSAAVQAASLPAAVSAPSPNVDAPSAVPALTDAQRAAQEVKAAQERWKQERQQQAQAVRSSDQTSQPSASFQGQGPFYEPSSGETNEAPLDPAKLTEVLDEDQYQLGQIEWAYAKSYNQFDAEARLAHEEQTAPLREQIKWDIIALAYAQQHQPRPASY